MRQEGEAEHLAEIASLLADRTRASFCLALLDDRAWTAGELARHAGVSRSTATEHINRLVDGDLLADQRQGRHRYVRLANWRVARWIEFLASQMDSPRESTQTQSGILLPRPLLHSRAS